MPELITPSINCHRSFVAAMEEFTAEGRGTPSDNSMVGRDLQLSTWKSPEGFDEYITKVVADREENSPRPQNHVPSTTLWWVDGDEYIGRIAIRHRLTEWLLEHGGHIGYDIRSSRRRQGHATAMLAAALPVAYDLGVDPALITCDDDNIASRLVIEHNGGVLEDTRDDKRRYWVPSEPRTSVS